MRNLLLIITIFICGSVSWAQEFNATVTVDAEQTGQQNNQVFRTLGQQLTEFINNKSWTNDKFLNQERINANFTLIITSYEGTSFSGSLQVQASRPVFNSTYTSPLYNYNDRQVAFDYKEFEPLVFNVNSYDSNLVFLIAYHVYTVLGLDASTFELNGGDKYFEIAKQITNTASSGSFAGWKATDGTQSRYRFNDALVSQVYSEFHKAMYQYHREGLDIMAEDQKGAKDAIISSLNTLRGINDRRPNSYILRTFFDAKVDEIKNIFSGGPAIDLADLKENLNRMAPTRRSTWSEIR